MNVSFDVLWSRNTTDRGKMLSNISPQQEITDLLANMYTTEKETIALNTEHFTSFLNFLKDIANRSDFVSINNVRNAEKSTHSDAMPQLEIQNVSPNVINLQGSTVNPFNGEIESET
ncbi:unknown [Neodiprion lecontei nucleopolyhedrovirus]|uniref:Uncharacterized protein n=1 Tax=Neodiprion lecontei nucleopolyhedrovirus (strain Canada) TaxID=654906 RepID=Q6JPD8_NPVNC|nr:unknown [Neodiprion lecontei nucleopolyhedrovirus]AAQ99113.1 unknown [Neodiprion lecontei nucleopolyhedrovirus]